MQYKELEGACRCMLAEELELDASLITAESQLRETLGLDSLDFVDLVVIVQERWGVTLQAQDFVEVGTFGEFCRMLAERIGVEESTSSDIQ